MKICYIASHGVHTERWLSYFTNKGHEVHLITPEQSQGNNLKNVNLHRLKRFKTGIPVISSMINILLLTAQVKQVLRHINPDTLHAHCVEDTALLGAISGFHPFIATAWGSDLLIAPKESRLSRWIVKYVIKKADIITCDAEHMHEALSQTEKLTYSIRS